MGLFSKSCSVWEISATNLSCVNILRDRTCRKPTPNPNFFPTSSIDGLSGGRPSDRSLPDRFSPLRKRIMQQIERPDTDSERKRERFIKTCVKEKWRLEILTGHVWWCHGGYGCPSAGINMAYFPGWPYRLAAAFLSFLRCTIWYFVMCHRLLCLYEFCFLFGTVLRVKAIQPNIWIS